MDNFYVTYVQGMVYAVSVLCMIFAASWVANKKVAATFNANKELENGNLAVAIRRFGMYLSVSLAMLGYMSSSVTHGLLKDLWMLFYEGSLMVVLIMLSTFFTDKFILPKLNNNKEVKQGNVAVALVEAGAYIATGLIAAGSFTGNGDLLPALVFFVLGQVVLALIVRVYELATSFSAVEDVSKGNTAAGLMLAGILISIGLILKGSVAGEFTSWDVDVFNFFVSTCVGIVLLGGINYVVDRKIFAHKSLNEVIESDKNIAIVLITVTIKIAVALAISANVVS